jgi:hypothetical protein
LAADHWEKNPARHFLAGSYHMVAEVIGWDRAIEFGMKVWREKRPPSKTKTDPVRGGGRGVIYIPRRMRTKDGKPSEIVSFAGDEIASLLVKTLPGEFLYFPCIIAANKKRRNEAIAEQLSDGFSVHSIAFAFDMTERNVRRIRTMNSI